MKKISFLITAALLFFTSCLTTSVDETAEKSAGENLFETGTWYATTDSYGSSFSGGEIVDGEINVDFTIAKKVGDEWPYIELICQAGKSLEGVESVTLDYKCSKPLKIKLSQSDFGFDGDQTYAHYFIEVPQSEEWSSVTVYIDNFAQPSWAMAPSTEVGLKLENVDAIYLVPGADYNIGEDASLSVRSMVIN